jgi:hypothetical protein
MNLHHNAIATVLIPLAGISMGFPTISMHQQNLDELTTKHNHQSLQASS